MSDGRDLPRKGAALGTALLALWAAGPVAASACHALPAGFELCADGTPWAEARRVAFDRGVAFEAGGWWLEAVDLHGEFPAGVSIDDVLDALIAAENEEARAEGLPAAEIVTRARFRTDTLDVSGVTVLADLGADGGVIPMASMIAESGGYRIALMLDHMDEITPDALHAALREIVAMVRPASGG